MFKTVFSVFMCLLLGCSAQKGDGGLKVVRLGVWGSPEEVKIIRQVMDEWEKSRPNIRVRIDHTNYGGYMSKILTQIAGGAAPDVICTEVDMFVNFAKKGVLAPLDEFIEADEQFSVDSFFPEVVDRFTVDGKLYVVPRDTAPFACVYYNKALFDQAGLPYPTDDWTMEDLLSLSKQLTIPGDGQIMQQYGFYAWAWQNFVYSMGGQLVDDVKNPTRCMLDKPEALEGLTFYADLINKHKVMPAPVAMSNLGMGITAMFTSGKLAMFASGIWETPVLRERTQALRQKGQNFAWDVVMFPKGKKRAFGTGGSGYGIVSSSRNKQEAYEVIKALCGLQGQKSMSQTGLIQPANRDLANSPAWIRSGDLPANKGMLNKAVQHVVYNPFHERWAEAQQLYVVPKLELVFNGKMNAKDAVALFIEPVNDILSGKTE